MKRPLGITILCVLHLIGGILLLFTSFWMLVHVAKSQAPLEAVAQTRAFLIVGMLFLTVLAITAAIGMWRGAEWGWWAGAFWYAFAIIRNASALLMIPLIADEIEPGARGPGYYYFKHGGRVVVSALILLYFFKGNVLEYFGLTTLRKWQAVGKLFGTAIGIAGGASLVAALF